MLRVSAWTFPSASTAFPELSCLRSPSFLEAAFGQQFDEAVFAQPAAELRRGGFVLLHVQQERGELGAFQCTPSLASPRIFRGALHRSRAKSRSSRMYFSVFRASRDTAALRDVDVPALNQFLHVAEKKVSSSVGCGCRHVRVGHQNDLW